MKEYLLKPRIYGKLPLQGDFIDQLPDVFTSTWDTWLKQGLGYTRDYFTQNWKSIYYQSPCWRFFLAPEICGNSAWIGIILPSHDKSGTRLFPVTLAVELPPFISYQYFESKSLCSWLQRLEVFMREIIANKNQLSLEAFQKSLPSLKLKLEDESDDEVTLGKKPKEVYFYSKFKDNQQIDDFYEHLRDNFFNANKPSHFCLWASNVKNSSRLFSTKLPSAEFFGAFLDEDYPSWGWESIYGKGDETIRPLKRVQGIYKDLKDNQPLTWQSSALTDVGNRRAINEDKYLAKDNIGLWAVADGMGGYESGDFASEMVVDLLSTLTKPYKMGEFTDSVEKKIIEANDKLLQHFTERNSQGGCTIICLLAFAYHATVLWAGDSRLYCYRDNKLKMLTRDHSVAEDAVDKGEMSAEEAEFHPSGNVLTRAVGIETPLFLSVDMFPIQREDILLLCSDGLYKEMTIDEIEQQISVHKTNIDFAADSLMNISLERKGRDNITIVLVKIA